MDHTCALLIIDQKGEATGEAYHFCSPYCRSYMTRELVDLYRSEGLEVRTGRADPTKGSRCEGCGKTLV